ncbi:MAG: hypothetical protein ISS35_04675 [Kiritimatiellae bacterium]|nr:hypothetical protein [Kiritimatiellia bacterium]
MTDPKHSILNCSASNVKTLLNEAVTEDQLWSAEDLQDVCNHQWDAPLAIDLNGLEDTHAERVETLAAAKGLLLRSFGDLLEHPHPPLELLMLAKEFAKRSLSSPHATLPHDVARMLYFASIATALSRCNRRITTLSDDQIAEGIRWALSRDWLLSEARAVLTLGLETLKLAGRRSS